MAKWLFYYVLLICGLSVQAQDPVYSTISKEQGLPSSAVYDIFQDKNGFIWFATDAGICRYDGINIKTFNYPQHVSKAGTGITQDRWGRIWYMNFDGYLFYVDKDSLYRLKEESLENPIGFRYTILGNSLLLAREDGIHIYDLANLTLKTILVLSPEIGYPEKTGGFVSDANYFYLIGSIITKIDSNGFWQKMPFSLISNPQVETIRCYNIPCGNSMYAMSRTNRVNAYFRYNADSTLTTYPFKGTNFIANVSVTDQDIWFCSRNGVFLCKNHLGLAAENRHFFADKSISCVIKDREGNYWMGTTNEGVLFIPDLHTLFLSFAPYQAHKLVVEGDKWMIGTKKNELLQYLPSKNTSQLLFQSSNAHEFVFLTKDKSHFYFSSDLLYQTDKKGKILHIDPLAVKNICRIDNKYIAYSATGTFGLMQVNASTERSIWDSLHNHNLNSLSKNSKCSQFAKNIRAKYVVYDSINSLIYFGTNQGLYKISPKEIGEVLDKNEKILVTGLANFKGETYLLYKGELVKIKENGRLVPVILTNQKILFDKMKLVNHFLFLIKENELYALDLENKSLSSLINLGEVVGEINDINLFEDKLLITSLGGIVQKEWKQEKRIIQPRFVVNSVYIGNQNFTKTENKEVPYYQNDVQIDYSILSFATQSHYPLYYRMNRKEWKLTDKKLRTLQFNALAPGDYLIEFRLGSNNDFPVQQIKFKICKALWQRYYFWGSIALLITFLGIFYYQRQTQILKKNNELEIEKLALENNLRNSMLTSLRAQMNPHFFYNALNSIQAFIFSDDRKNAATYLAKFAKLTRMTLQMSEKQSVSLSEELTALTLYLELEKVRFEDDFSYEFQIAPELNPDMLKIPAMIVQPYVENAIKHGLLHKKGEKKLKISLFWEAQQLLIWIEDNGIGRKRSYEINAARQDKYPSFATEANSKRIELLNKGGENIQLQYIDKEDSLGQAQGTIVKIVFSY